MNQQEIKSNQAQLKQIRKEISELKAKEQMLERELAQYQSTQILGKYYHDESSGAFIKPLQVDGREIKCVTISNNEAWYGSCYIIEYDTLTLPEIGSLEMQEISKEEFEEQAEKIWKEAREAVLGGV